MWIPVLIYTNSIALIVYDRNPLFWFRSDTETETQIGRYFRPVLLSADTVTDTETTFQRENLVTDKAELLQEGTFFLIHLFGRDVLVMKKL